MLTIHDVDFRALVAGEVVVAETSRGEATEGDEYELAAGAARPASDVKPAYQRLVGLPPPEGSWTGVVVAVHPAQAFDAESGASRHILTRPPEGDLIVVRVYGDAGPVLSDVAFEARVRSLEGALRA